MYSLLEFPKFCIEVSLLIDSTDQDESYILHFLMLKLPSAQMPPSIFQVPMAPLTNYKWLLLCSNSIIPEVKVMRTVLFLAGGKLCG